MDGNFEVRRKIFHILLGTLLALLIFYGIYTFIISLIILVIGILISLTSLYYKLPIIEWFIERFDRKEHSKFPGKSVIYLFAGLTLLLLLFKEDVVAGAVMIWAFGDAAASLIGRFGEHKHVFNDAKVIEGTIAGIIFGTIAASFFISWIPALIAAIIAMIFEAIDFRFLKHQIDDNVVVLLVAGVVLHFAVILF